MTPKRIDLEWEVVGRPSRHPLFFGWKVAWLAFTVAVFSFGIGFSGPLVFLQTLHATKGWTISSVSAAITVHFLWSAALVTYLPTAHRRFGVAWITFGGVSLTALGAVAWKRFGSATPIKPGSRAFNADKHHSLTSFTQGVANKAVGVYLRPRTH